MEVATGDTSTGPAFDVFLSYNSLDKPIVERIAERLKRADLEPWLDMWALTPGGRWQEELAAGMQASSACAYFVGPSGAGDWEREELAVALSRAANDRPFRLFPVLLPGVSEPFDRTTLPPFLSTRTWVDLRRGLDDTRGFQALVNAIKGIPMGPAVPLVALDDACPYRGLQTFDEAHADLFFGRDSDVQAILEQLKATRFLAVLGPSGSGKSSLVRAGVIPALRRAALAGSDAWTIEILRPGGRPLDALAARLVELDPNHGMRQSVDELARNERSLHLAGTLALTRRPAASRLVWVVDQTEELFTLGQDEAQRSQFIANLVYAASIPDGPSVVILTLRADFYARCADYPALSALLARHQYLVGPMDEAGLRAAVEEPARAVGLEFESGLVDTILEDVGSEPGRLPLLEHALLELWERRRGGLLSLEAYRESGGVQGAIAQRAETIYEGFDPPRQAIARHALMRLTQPGEGTEDTRRRATLREVAGRAEEEVAVEDVVRDLTDARLLTTSADQQTGERWVDISHEALIRGWPRLRSWLDEDRTALRVHRRITDAAEEWERLGRDDGALYRGARLAEASEWRTSNEALLNDLEREFLDASIALATRERARRERLRKGVTIAAVASALVFLVLAGYMADQRRIAQEAGTEAEIQWRRAEGQRKIALSRQLAAQAGSQNVRQDTALLLALEANQLSDAADVRGSLLAALTNTRVQTHLFPDDNSYDLAFSPDGKMLASGGSDGITVWDVATRAQIGDGPWGEGKEVFSVAFSPEGKMLASGRSDGIALWDVASRAPIGQPFGGSSAYSVFRVLFSPDGKTLVSEGGDDAIRLWDVASRAPIGDPLKGGSDEVWSTAVSPSGILASGGGDGSILLWDLASRSPIGTPLLAGFSPILSIAFSPDGKTLASGSNGGTIGLWDVASGSPIGETLRGEGRIYSVAFSRDGKILASTQEDGKIVLWDVASGARIGDPLHGHSDRVWRVTFSPDGETFASGGDDQTIILWDVGGESPLGEPLPPEDAATWSVAFSPDGETFASGSDRATIVLWDVAKRAPIGEPLDVDGDVHHLTFSSDSETLDTLVSGGKIVLWDVASRAPIGEWLPTSSGFTSAAFSPDGETLALGGDEGTVVLWDVASRAPSGESLPGDGTPLTSLAFSPDGETIASGGSDGKVVLSDVASRAPIGEPLRLGSSPVMSVAFSPDGEMLASGSFDWIRMWRVANQVVVAERRRQTMDLAFSPDGDLLAQAGSDGAIVLWDVASLSPIGEPLRAGSRVDSLAFSPDGETLASAGREGTILWSVGRKSLSAVACRIANRNLSHEEWDHYVTDETYEVRCPDLPVP